MINKRTSKNLRKFCQDLLKGIEEAEDKFQGKKDDSVILDKKVSETLREKSLAVTMSARFFKQERS